MGYDDLSTFKQRRIKFCLRRSARQKGSKDEIRALRNEQYADQIAAEAWARFESGDVQPDEFGDGRIMDQILRFLQFLLDNWDIIAPIFGIAGMDSEDEISLAAVGYEV